jgi:hypothetical protein
MEDAKQEAINRPIPTQNALARLISSCPPVTFRNPSRIRYPMTMQNRKVSPYANLRSTATTSPSTSQADIVGA